MEERIMGHQTKVEGGRKRCHYCKRPRQFGYVVREGPCQGFFCGAGHWKKALETMKDLKKKYNL